MARKHYADAYRAQIQRPRYREPAREISEQSEFIVFELLKKSECLELIRET